MNVQMFDGRKRARVTQSGNQTILIHGKSGTTEVPIKVDADGNVQISMDAVTVDLGQVTLHQGNPGVNAWPVTLSGNKVTEEALDVYVRSLLDASQDSVALGGDLAASLARKPEEIKIVQDTVEMTNKQTLTILDTASHINIINFEMLHVGGSGTSLRLLADLMDSQGNLTAYELLGVTGSGDPSLQYITAYTTPVWEALSSYDDAVAYKRGFLNSRFVSYVQGDGEDQVWKVFFRPGARAIRCPHGARWRLQNTIDAPLKIGYTLTYEVMPI